MFLFYVISSGIIMHISPICLYITNISIQSWFIQKLKETIEGKEETLRQSKDAHNKEMAELNDANQELQQRFDKVINIIIHVLI